MPLLVKDMAILGRLRQCGMDFGLAQKWGRFISLGSEFEEIFSESDEAINFRCSKIRIAKRSHCQIHPLITSISSIIEWSNWFEVDLRV